MAVKHLKNVKYYLVAVMILAGAAQSANACVKYYTRANTPGEVVGCSLSSVTSGGYCIYSCKTIWSYRSV
jgi:hypothetical protein